MTFVFRSTARTIVRCSAPSRLLATIGKTWRRSGRLNRTANVPSLRILTGSPRRSRGRRGGSRRERSVRYRPGNRTPVHRVAYCRARSKRQGRRIAQRPVKALFQHVPQIALGLRLAVAAAQGENPLEILCHLGPIAVEASRRPSRRACSPRCSWPSRRTCRPRLGSQCPIDSSSAANGRRCTSC